MIAARRRNVGVMDLFISKRADLETLSKNERNKIHGACDCKNLKIFQFLRYTFLPTLIGPRKEQVPYSLVDKRNVLRSMSLHLVAKDQNTKILEHLLDQSLVSDINILTSDLKTALYIVHGHSLSSPLALSALLLKADLNISYVSGRLLPVQLVAREKDLAVIAIFCRIVATQKSKTVTGLTARYQILAMQSGQNSEVNMFRKHNSKQQKDTALDIVYLNSFVDKHTSSRNTIGRISTTFFGESIVSRSRQLSQVLAIYEKDVILWYLRSIY